MKKESFIYYVNGVVVDYDLLMEKFKQACLNESNRLDDDYNSFFDGEFYALETDGTNEVDGVKFRIENNLIHDWYVDEFPNDELGDLIDRKATFIGLFECLDRHNDVYEYLGNDCDSIVRERVFEKLSSVMDCDYDYIYNQWMNC